MPNKMRILPRVIYFLCYGKGESTVNDVWYLDSGCSNHMYGNREIFSKLDDSYRSNITLGNNNIVDVAAKGAMDVQTKEGIKVFKIFIILPS